MSIATAFDTFNKVRLESPLLESIWRDGFGDEYASGARPNAFYPQAILDKIASLATGKSLLDIGCGHGQTGAYLANRLGMTLFGIDPSAVSIELAKKHKGTFWVASAESTGIKTKVDMAICMDVMLYLDKPAAIEEVSRILKPGGIFAFTTWEQKGYNPRLGEALGAVQVDDYRPLLSDFEILVYESEESWKELQNNVLRGIVNREEQLTGEIGEQPTAMLVKMATAALSESSKRRYILAIARRKKDYDLTSHSK